MIAGMKPGAAVLADAWTRAPHSEAVLARQRNCWKQAAVSDASAAAWNLDLSIAVFHNKGAAEGLLLMDRMAESRRNADYYLARAPNAACVRKTAADAMGGSRSGDPCRSRTLPTCTGRRRSF